MIKYYSAILFLLVVLQTACSKQESSIEKIDQSVQLTELFRSLYLGEFAKHYPHSAEMLEICKTYKGEDCLGPYEKVKTAKQHLLEMKSRQTLLATLDIIKFSCQSPDEVQANFVCHGALMSLYFYPEAEYDAEIFEFIKSLSPSMQSLIFNRYFNWFINRPNATQWVDYLNTTNIDWEHDGSKEQTLKYFSGKIEPSFWTQ